ncbi:hypothetical protein LK07_01315 [Streptomyces pluripotens]|uniref:Uncharacterized protein n=1 Tax=Streptomyces pluripotens TaxID=1355015 RepID=A0A221NSD3_9ACTN|nr:MULTISPECIES: hypothetical protein [Streptomyces]ARP68626.1 hypothetical protein LK06_000235 [Streptomyces pluripotens]ASN22887.1 hypothetical protein LK07_01315 [Streptomyces pluripotens]KIE26734.1 hypothetical protein LK08_12540 [Streptomyces sp. MUSC 125]MCH0559285.1 hypothetical protein [Streptomyces sp. MUM 16J]
MAAPVDGLDPVRTELLRAARASADAVLARAQAEAEETLRSARRTAAQVLSHARRAGAADGAAAADRERERALQDAWAVELAARAEAYASLRAEVRAGVQRALADGAVPPERLAQTARSLLGADAQITAVPDGGVRAKAPGRRVDLSAQALADRAVDALGVAAETLWEVP